MKLGEQLPLESPLESVDGAAVKGHFSIAVGENRLHEPLDSVLSRPHGGWSSVVATWRETREAGSLVEFIDARVASGVSVYPAAPLRALELTPLERTRVVIVGQDPYHGPGQAQGLAFSVNAGVRIPPSLRNIYKELQRDLDIRPSASGDLGSWAEQGVLLLNTTLTVEGGQAASHSRRGWESLTDLLIAEAARQSAASAKVFMLWGAHAQSKAQLIDSAVSEVGGKALVLKANHPSPLSATRPPVPFIGCGHFGLANAFLQANDDEKVIDWRVRQL